MLNEDRTMDAQDFQAEITDVLKSCEEVNHANALRLNKEMQQRLLTFRQELELALKELNERYNRNRELISRLYNSYRSKNGVGKRGAYLRGGTFYFQGNMFFKDINNRNCPNNIDYEYRRNVQKEMFPMDLDLRARHVWSMMDKIGIVQGIKEQIIQYLNDKNKMDEILTAHRKKIHVHSEKLIDLVTKVKDTTFRIDWHEISAHNLRSRHSSSSCQAMWELYLQPHLKKTDWTPEENQRLIKAANKYDLNNWPQIAAEVGERSDYQCFVQYFTSLARAQPDRWLRWDKSDDQLLLDSINNHTENGVIKWNRVAACFPQKSKSALMGRYYYSLHPKISHEPFTNEEDVLLLAAIKEYGTKFNCLPRTLFPNRSLPQLRSRFFNVLQNRHKQLPWTIQDDEILLKFTQEHGTSNWLLCSEALNERHSRVSCRTRYMTIQRYFKRNPKAKLEEIPRLRCKRSTKSSKINVVNWEEKVVEMQLAECIDEEINDSDNEDEVEFEITEIKIKEEQKTIKKVTKREKGKQKNTIKPETKSRQKRKPEKEQLNDIKAKKLKNI